METREAFGTVADYYDEAYRGESSVEDVEMFTGFAKRFGGPVLARSPNDRENERSCPALRRV
jgi:hypothetical protein